MLHPRRLRLAGLLAFLPFLQFACAAGPAFADPPKAVALAAAARQETAEPPLAAAPAPRPTVPDLPVDDGTPAPKPNPANVAGKLKKGQWYIVDHVHPLLVDGFSLNTGSVTITAKTGPLHVPAEIAVGRKPDKDDPSMVTVPGPFVYIVKPVTTGDIVLDVLPTLNSLDKDGKQVGFTRSDLIRRTFGVDVGPAPLPDPKPPTPDPKPPTPPTPDKKPPIAGDGFKVAILYESGAGLTAAQQSFMYSSLVREYLNGKCAKVGGKPEYRVVDVNATVTADTQVWKDVLARPRGGLPWLLISDGKTGYEGPIPDTFDKAFDLLKQFGG